jgi:hypothetical protein
MGTTFVGKWMLAGVRILQNVAAQVYEKFKMVRFWMLPDDYVALISTKNEDGNRLVGSWDGNRLVGSWDGNRLVGSWDGNRLVGSWDGTCCSEGRVGGLLGGNGWTSQVFRRGGLDLGCPATMFCIGDHAGVQCSPERISLLIVF